MSEMDLDLNYYKILGVHRAARVDVIRVHYRRLMQQDANHPDLGGDTRKAAIINKAYAVLSDPAKRREHDAHLDVLERVAAGFAVAPEEKVLDPTRECLFCERPHDYCASDLAEFSCGTCGSTLQPVDNLRMEPTGQRSMHRLDRMLDLTMFTHWRQKQGFVARTADISPQGLRMMAPCNLQRGQNIRLVSSVFDAVGKISHCEPGRSGWREVTIAGVAFLTLRFNRAAGVFVSRRA